MIHRIESEELIKIQDNVPVADVRTPAEFEKGHIPGASNLPLFSNEQRVLVGTMYKQESKEAAILLGFDLAGPKWSGFIRQSLEMAPQKKIAVHCWRGGMRSGAMAWALELYGFEVFLVKGGYKSYRKWVLRQFEKDYLLYVLGGLTGSGKTKILHHMRMLGEQVIDLEDIAQHQGSSYGTLNKLIQPSQEQFENNFAEQLRRCDHSREIWVEDEGLNIGKCNIARSFWHRMQRSPLIDLQVSVDQRVGALVKEYGSLDKDFLVECTDRIRKRLGFEQTKQAIDAIREDRMDEFIRLVLFYYDKTYRTALKHRSSDRIFPVPLDNTDPASSAGLVLDFARGLAVAGRSNHDTTSTGESTATSTGTTLNK